MALSETHTAQASGDTRMKDSAEPYLSFKKDVCQKGVEWVTNGKASEILDSSVVTTPLMLACMELTSHGEMGN